MAQVSHRSYQLMPNLLHILPRQMTKRANCRLIKPTSTSHLARMPTTTLRGVGLSEQWTPLSAVLSVLKIILTQDSRRTSQWKAGVKKQRSKLLITSLCPTCKGFASSKLGRSPGQGRMRPDPRAINSKSTISATPTNISASPASRIVAK